MLDHHLLNERSLVVFDIDNTLLKSHHEFGSDQWFNWQSEELIKQSSLSLAKSFDELLDLQAMIFTVGKMNLVEDSIPEILQILRTKNIPFIALTSRGPDMRNITERELIRNGLSLPFNKFGQDIPVEFIPEMNDRKASYQKGIFMTSGMHKGQMLKYLLSRFKTNYHSIIFIDDHKKHTDRVFEIFKIEGIDINTFRYGHEDKKVQNFISSEKTSSIILGKKLLELKSELNNN
jgi:hypothetical protein